MNNIFLYLKKASIKEEQLEKLLYNYKKPEIAQYVTKFYSKYNQSAEACAGFILSLLKHIENNDSNTKISSDKTKLLTLLVFYTARLEEKTVLNCLEEVEKLAVVNSTKVRFFSNVYKSTNNQEVKKWLLFSTIKSIEKYPKISLYSSFVESFDRLVYPLTFLGTEELTLYLKLINYLYKHVTYKFLWSKYLVSCLKQVNKENCQSKETNELMIKLIRESCFNEDTALLLSHTYLKTNPYFYFFEVLVFGDFARFNTLKTEQLSKYGIDISSLQKRVKINAIPRVLAGIKLASYRQISTILDIYKDQVEDYVIEAIKEGVLYAKIDEFYETIIIQYASAYFSNTHLRCLRQEYEAKLQKDITDVCTRIEQICSR